MDKQNLMPQAAQPVNRITNGQLPTELAELSEEALQLQGAVSDSAFVLSSYFSDRDVDGWNYMFELYSSYDGEDAD